MRLIPVTLCWVLAATLTQAAPAPQPRQKPKEKPPAPSRSEADALPAELRAFIRSTGIGFIEEVARGEAQLREAKTEKERALYRNYIAKRKRAVYEVPISFLKTSLRVERYQGDAVRAVIEAEIRVYEAKYEDAKKRGLVK